MTDTPPPVRVVVAGGGTAGWLAATALVKQLGPLVEVTLVESDEIGTVGVGESTIPTTRSFHQFIGVDEREFVRATNATFKLGISFEGWRRAGDRYFHPFGTVGRSIMIADFQHFWLQAREKGVEGYYSDYSLETQAADAGKFASGEGSPLAYAYHLDATAYASFLRGIAEPAGVTRREGRIEQVELDETTGAIAGLRLASGERIAGDLFLDCTGFRALLIGQALGVPFEDWSPWLSTDSAFAVQSESVGPPVPYTRAITHEAGWRWRIPLQHRVGNGIVFASAHMEPDRARETLLASLDGPPLFDPRLIRYTTGMRRQHWAKNCIALGLAGGFIEPLESTSIHLVMIAVTRLIQQFPFTRDHDALAQRFNEQARAEWEHVRDFIILHYHLTEREEPFWRACATMPVPDSLAERIALFAESAMAHQDGHEIFRVDSWVSVMLGQGVTPRSHHRIAAMLPPGALAKSLADLRAGNARTLRSIPSHGDFVTRLAAPNRL
jgi:tryptophan halogenase